MVPMKKRTAVAVIVGVWIATLSLAAALTYELTRAPDIAQMQCADWRELDMASGRVLVSA